MQFDTAFRIKFHTAFRIKFHTAFCIQFDTAFRTQFDTAFLIQSDTYLCAAEQFSEVHNILDLRSGCGRLISRPPYPLP